MFSSKPKLEDTLFTLKFTTKQMERASRKCEKEERAQKAKVTKALKQGNTEGARIYAENAIRKKNEGLNYLRMAARIDAVSSRVQTAMMTKEISKQMGGVVKGLDKVVASMDLEKISSTMAKFEGLFEDLDTHTQVMDSAMSTATTLSTPQDQVEALMTRVAEENGLEVIQQLSDNPVATGTPQTGEGATLTTDQEDQLSRRLAALRQPN
ncbi:charged multivesicular body protein 1a-like [Halichondria panicea]|uniref:charged multivesicular body protein 1a-like n=1 Tax=Halichondria panicea TaxID=6063 RepID=UPI00312B3524